MDKKSLLIVGSIGLVAGMVAIIRRESENKNRQRNIDNKRVLILVNHEVVIYNFRLELVERLITEGYEVHISTPSGDRVEKLREMGALIHNVNFDRHGMNPSDEIKILWNYRSLIKSVKPLIVFGYTIKPNIYGSLVARSMSVPFVANITGLGTAVENVSIKQKLIVLMYRLAFGGKKARIQKVFFQNEENEKFFNDNGIALDKHGLLPGSGVNTERFPYAEYPACGDGLTGKPIKFAFISRIMVEKGIDQYLAAAEKIKKMFPSAEFHVCGFFEPEYDRRSLDKLINAGTVIYDGNIDDVSGFMGAMHCIVHPTYYPEGLSNVLLEASSTGRPIITCNRAGCREVIKDNGYLVKEKNTEDLIHAIRAFILQNYKQKVEMGKRGRALVVEHFDRSIVVNAYMREIRYVESFS